MTHRPTPDRLPQWIVCDDADGVVTAGLQRIFAAGRDAWRAQRHFHVALAGGSTPERLYQRWAAEPQFDWQRTEVYWGDERAVPADDANSNHHMAQQALLKHVPIPAHQVHRMPAERTDRDRAARDYEALLRRRLGSRGRLDLLLLGLGADAHTASLFPHSPALQERERWVVPAPAPVIAPRLTGTPIWFNAARHVVFLVTGASKRTAVQRVRTANEPADRVPALLIQPQGTLTWLLDAAADPGSAPAP